MMTSNNGDAMANLDRLGKAVRTEIDAYHGLLRRAGVHLFRAGQHLFEAKALVREAGVTWADWLRRERVADSTARQAIDLYRNAKAMGHDEIDLEGLSITDAKIKYAIVTPKPKKASSSPTLLEDATPPPEAERSTLPPSPDDGDSTPHSSPVAWEAAPRQPPQDKGGRPREVVLRELEEIYGGETEELPLTLPLTTWKLLDILMCQEEVEQPSEVLSRAVREYWLRHGDPANVQSRARTAESEAEVVYSGASA